LAAVSPHIISAVMPLRTYKVGDNRKDDIPSTMAKLQNLKYPFLGFILGFVLIFFLSPLLNSYKVVVVVAILWTAALVITGVYKTRWKCPRGHKPFQQWQAGNPAAIGNKCMHCGLPKWAESDEG